jgi:uncharacterized protein DUF6580
MAPLAKTTFSKRKERTMTYLIFVLSVLTRFIPHIPNFSPVFGALLFAGAYIKKRDSIWFPVVVLALSDYLLTRFVYQMHLGWSELITLAGFAAVAVIGWWLRSAVTFRKFTAAALAGPTAFFLISNFGVWLGWKMYAPTWQGLVACYAAGLPFYRNSVVSSLLFGGVLFGLYELYLRRVGDAQLHIFPA